MSPRLKWGGPGVVLATVLAAVIAAGGGADNPGGNRSPTHQQPRSQAGRSRRNPPSQGFPNAKSTGIPVGTTLTPATVDGDGNLDVTKDGSAVNAVNVPDGCILIKAVGVTVRNSHANCISTDFNARAKNPANARAHVQDSEFDCGNPTNTGIPGVDKTAIFDENMDVERVDIHGCENGFDMYRNASLTDSYIHDLAQINLKAGFDPHTDGIQSANGSNVTIQHNTIYGFSTGCQWPNRGGTCNGTSAININNSPTGPTSTNTTIRNNLLAGGAVALYCPKQPTNNFRVTDNHFSTVYSPKVGEFGPSTDCADSEILSGNVYHKTGRPITLP